MVLPIPYVRSALITYNHSLLSRSSKEIARHIRPRTLRALYGKDKMKNAVHCTDLAEDATLEVRKSWKDFSSCSAVFSL